MENIQQNQAMRLRPPAHQKRRDVNSANNDLTEVHVKRKSHHQIAQAPFRGQPSSKTVSASRPLDQKEVVKREIIAQDFLTKNIYVNPLTYKQGINGHLGVSFGGQNMDDIELQMLQLKSQELLPQHQIEERYSRTSAVNTTSHGQLQKSKYGGKQQYQMRNLKNHATGYVELKSANASKIAGGTSINFDNMRSDSSMDPPFSRDKFFKNHMKQEERRQTTHDADTRMFGKENIFNFPTGNKQKLTATKVNLQRKGMLRELGSEEEKRYAQKLKDLSRMGADLKRLKQDARKSNIANFRLKSNGPLTVLDLQERERELKMAIEADPDLAKLPKVQKELAKINKGLGRRTQKKKKDEDAESFDEQEIMLNMMRQPEFAGVQVPDEMFRAKGSRTDQLRQVSNVSPHQDSEQDAMEEVRREAHRRLNNDKAQRRAASNLGNNLSVGAQQGMQKSAYKMPAAAAMTSTGFAFDLKDQSEPASAALQMNKTQNGMGSMKNLEKLSHGLRACKGESGFFNPTKAFDCLNNIQKEQDPEAYESEVVKTINAQKARLELMKQKNAELQQKKKTEAQQIDKALFDFDEEIDNLEEVEDRYPAGAKIASNKGYVTRGEMTTEESKRNESPDKPLGASKAGSASKLVCPVKRPQRPAGLSSNVLKDIERVKAELKGKKGPLEGDGIIPQKNGLVKVDYKPPPAYTQQQEAPVPSIEEIRMMRLQKLKDHAVHPSMSDIAQVDDGAYDVSKALQLQSKNLEMIGEVPENSSKYQTAKFYTNENSLSEKQKQQQQIKVKPQLNGAQEEPPTGSNKFIKPKPQIPQRISRQCNCSQPSKESDEQNNSPSIPRNQKYDTHDNRMFKSGKLPAMEKRASRESHSSEVQNNEQGMGGKLAKQPTCSSIVARRQLKSLSPACLSNASDRPISLKERAKKLRTLDNTEDLGKVSATCIGIIYGVDQHKKIAISPPLEIVDQEHGECLGTQHRNSLNGLEKSAGSRKKRTKGRFLPKFDRDTHPLNAWQRKKEVMKSTKNLRQLDEVIEQNQEQSQRPYDDQMRKFAEAPMNTHNSSSSKNSQTGKMRHVLVNKRSVSSQSKDYNISPSPEVCSDFKKRIKKVTQENVSELPKISQRNAGSPAVESRKEDQQKDYSERIRPYHDQSSAGNFDGVDQEALKIQREIANQSATDRDGMGNVSNKSKKEDLMRMRDIYAAPFPKPQRSTRTGAVVSRQGMRPNLGSGKLETASSLESSLEKRSHMSRLQRYVENIDKQSAEIRHNLSRSSLDKPKAADVENVTTQQVDAPYNEGPMLVLDSTEKQPVPTLPPAPRNPRLDYSKQQVVPRPRIVNTGQGSRAQQPLYLYKRKMQQTKNSGFEGVTMPANLQQTQDATHNWPAQSSAQSSSIVFSGGARESVHRWTGTSQPDRLSLSRDAFTRRNKSGGGPMSISTSTRRTETTRGMLELHQKLQLCTKKFRAEKQARQSYHQRHMGQASMEAITPSNNQQQRTKTKQQLQEESFNQRVSAFITERIQPQKSSRRYDSSTGGSVAVPPQNQQAQPPATTPHHQSFSRHEPQLELRKVGLCGALDSFKEQNTASLLYSGGNASDADELDLHDVLAAGASIQANEALPPRHLMGRNTGLKARTINASDARVFGDYGGASSAQDRPPLAATALVRTSTHSRQTSSMMTAHPADKTERGAVKTATSSRPRGAISSMHRTADARQSLKNCTINVARQPKTRVYSGLQSRKNVSTSHNSQPRHKMFL